MIDDVRGAAFPFRIDPATGGLAWAVGEEKIRQNIRIILGTRRGERPLVRDFGTIIHSLVHDPNDDVLADLLKTQAQQALLQWERRVMVTSAEVELSEAVARLRIRYARAGAPEARDLIVPLR